MQNKDELYYEAMDYLTLGNFDLAEGLLMEAKRIDPDYVQTYVGFANMYGKSKNTIKAVENIKIGYEKVLLKFPVWPDSMEWGDMNNRAYLRAIQYRADVYMDELETEKAIELCRLLLKLNPDDNQGVRYVLAGIYAEISGQEVNEMFDEGNKKQNWSALEKMVEIQNEKHKFWNKPINR